MCGISGIILKEPSDAGNKFDRFREASKLLKHRGPDYHSEFQSGKILLIHYRLSIIDLDERAHQPFFSHDKSHVCIFNGEIYNFKDLQIKFKIPQFTTSDTEILIETFRLFGLDALTEWNGIFATAILNIPGKKLFLARDRFGVKPLYVYEDKKVLMFASEAKVIMAWLTQMQLDYDGLAQYLWFGNTVSDKTIIRGIRKAAPGSIIEIDLESGRLKSEQKFWEIKGTPKVSPRLGDAVQTTFDLLNDAVKRQLISDVPIGVLLSGGLDSSSIVALASRHVGNRLDTYSVEFDYNIGNESELPKAALIARKFNTNHHELKISANDTLEVFQELVFQYDEPFAEAANIPLYKLAKACSSDRKVILQGDGGDEVFAGYRRYNVLDWLRFWQVVSFASQTFLPDRKWRERMKRMSFILRQDDPKRMAFYLTEDTPGSSPLTILNDAVLEVTANSDPFESFFEINEKYRSENRVQKMLFTDIIITLGHTYLEKVDKATMLASVESRVPFLDNQLTEFMLSLPSDYKIRYGEKKYMLKQAMKGILPEEILHGKKRGFDVPYNTWLRRDLNDFAKTIFTENPWFFNQDYLVRILSLHKEGTGNYGPLLWKSIVLASWLKIYSKKLTF